jgi:hypothetical protein
MEIVVMSQPFAPAARLVCLASVAACLLAPRASHAGAQPFDGTWSALDSSATAPSARREYAAIYDVQRNRYLSFGGFGFYAPDPGGLFKEAWSLALGPDPAWTPLAVSGTGPGERHSPQWGYDPARQRLIVFGGYGHHYPGGPNEYLNDVWQLSLDATPTWTELFPSGAPPTGRLAGAAVYDPLRQRIVGFGGTAGLLADTWELDLSGEPVWADVTTGAGGPPAGYGMTAIYDGARDRMVIFGGSTSDDYFGVHNDVWALDLADTPTWSKLAPLGTLPTARRTLTSVYDPLRDRLVIFGGWDSQSNDVSSFLGDAWALSLSGDLTWTALSPAGTHPVGRDGMAAAYDPVADRMVVYGGWSGVRMLSDTQFLTWGQASQAATLTAQATADSGVAHLHWGVADATGGRAAVYRRQSGTLWSSIATVERDGSGAVSFEDATVTPGGRYAYLLAVASERGQSFGGEVWVDIPTTTGVVAPPLAFALRPVWPSPLAGRFTVTFALAEKAPARLDLFDVTGRRALTREVGSLGPGVHEVDLGTAGDYESGLYFVRLTHGAQSRTTRVVIRGR